MTVLYGCERDWAKLFKCAIPRFSALAISVFIHFAALSAMILLRHTGKIRIQPVTEGVARIVRIDAGPAYLPLKANHSQPQGPRVHIRRQQLLSRQLRLTIPDAPEYEGSNAVLQEEATRWTSAITKSLNFHGVYLNHVYELAVLLSGDLPVTSQEELPPHFQSYVIVEITIDVDGHPAHVRTVAGIVTPAIEAKLLSAIRTFRYIPAKRDGLPIPSQRDIVIHIPS